MRAIIASLLLLGCSGLHEGERVGPFEGMLWAVDCATTTPHELAERYEYENPYYVCSEYDDLNMCPAIWVHKYRYEWAKKEWREKCERAA